MRAQSALDAAGDAELRRVVDLERMRPAGNRDRRTAIEIAGDGIRVHRRRHHDDPKIVARQPRLPDEREPEIRMDAALVELVEDDRPKVGEERILLQPGRQDAFGRQQHPGVRTELLLEADVPADLAAERPAAFDGNPPRDRPRRDAPRLQHDDRTVRGERRRHPRGLARAWRSRQHQRPSLPDERHDVRDEDRSERVTRAGRRPDRVARRAAPDTLVRRRRTGAALCAARRHRLEDAGSAVENGRDATSDPRAFNGSLLAAATLAQLSFSETVRLKTGQPGPRVGIDAEVAEPLELIAGAGGAAAADGSSLHAGDDFERGGVEIGAVVAGLARRSRS